MPRKSSTTSTAKTSKVQTTQADATLENLRVPPHSVEAEQAVLGGLMLDNTAWDRIFGVINENDFYRPEHRLIFRTLAILNHRNQPFDVITLAAELKQQNELDNAGGEIYLFELARNTPSVTNIVAYAEIVRERSVLRQLIGICNTTANNAFNPGARSSKEILQAAESQIFKIAEQQARGQGPVDISILLSQATTRIDQLYHSDEDITGLPTGFTDLDDMTSGLQKGELIIIAGRPSMGKTTLAMNIAEFAAIKSQKKPILVFSMEMPGEALAMRMLSSLGRIDQHKIRTGKLEEADWPRISSAVSMLSEAPLFVDDTASLSPAEISSRARRLIRSHGEVALIVIDYLQLMQIPGYRDNRVGEITEISRSLKAMAKELNVPVLALSQLNRGLEQRTDKRPAMSDLRESGAIEQDADLIIFIYRDEVYNENTQDKGIAEVILAKHRNGPTGKVKMTFLGQYTKFENFIATTWAPQANN